MVGIIGIAQKDTVRAMVRDHIIRYCFWEKVSLSRCTSCEYYVK